MNQSFRSLVYALAFAVSPLLAFQSASRADNGGFIAGGALGTGYVSRILVPAEVAATLLPAGLSLNQPQQPHPLLLMFFRHDRFSLYRSSNPLDAEATKGRFQLRASYDEFLLAIPEVHRAGGAHDFVYFQKIELNSLSALLTGRNLGFPKFFASFRKSEASNSVFSWKGERLLDASFQRVPSYDLADFRKGFQSRLSELEGDVIESKDGEFLCSKFYWNHETLHASPVSAEWKLYPSLSPALAGTFKSPAINSSPSEGSYRVSAEWRLAKITCQ